MASTRILIVDPGLRTGEGHHLGVDGMLGAAALALGYEPIILANASSPLASVSFGDATVPVRPSLPQSIYLGEQDRTYAELEVLNERARRQLEDLGSDLFCDPVRVLIHTTNETQVLGVAHWLSENMGTGSKRVESAVVALMFPPPLQRDDDELNQKSPAVREIYANAVRLMSSVPGVTVMGIGHTVAEDHTASSGVTVHVGAALVAGIGRTLNRQTPGADPTVLLYMGDAKIDKGFHMLPDIVRRLRGTTTSAKFVIHVSGSMVDRYAWILDSLASPIGEDARFELKRGRLSYEEFQGLWDSADLVLLAYHPGVYARKTSGICWDAMNAGVPAVAVADTWHMLELERYGHPVITSPAFRSEPLVDAILRAIDTLPALYAGAVNSRERFLESNDPRSYITQLVS
jgi:hypothetical protein